jgi:hypothetical protein
MVHILKDFSIKEYLKEINAYMYLQMAHIIEAEFKKINFKEKALLFIKFKDKDKRKINHN